MGCFLACFGTSKDAKIRRGNHHRHRILPRDQASRRGYTPVEVSDVAPNQEKTETFFRPVEVSVVAPNQEKTVILYRPIEVSIVAPNQGNNELFIATSESEIRDTLPAEQTSSGKRKKVVTFDSNIKTYEPVTFYEVDDHDTEKLEACEKDLSAKSSKVVNSNSEDGSTTSSLGSSFPPNHRYQNCIESDDEIEDESDCDVYDLDEDFDEDFDEDDDENLADDEDEDCYEDGYEYRDVYNAHDDGRERRLSDEFSSTESRTRDGYGYVHSVLNPVENLSQWKILKTKGIMPPHLKCTLKENSTPETPNQEIAVDASLSNWLPSSEPATKSKNNSIISFTVFTPERGSNSPKCLDDRPILGALTVEEIKKFSTPSSSPRKSPKAEDMPIIGSVGSYWSHDSDNDSGSVCSSYKGIPNTTSKYREDKRVNWHSTPFETRLDRVLMDKGGAKAHSEA